MPKSLSPSPTVSSDATFATYTKLLEQVVSGQPLTTILKAIAELLEKQLPDALASILLLSEDGQLLRHGAAPSLPEDYNQVIDGIAIGAGVGSCGNAAASGRITIVEDIATHPFWQDYKTIALQAGLRSCWSQPILSEQQQVIATFAIYHRHPQSPTAQQLQTLANLSALTRAAIEHSHVSKRFRLAQTLAQHLPVGLMVTDHHQRIVDVKAPLNNSVPALDRQRISDHEAGLPL